MKYLINDFKVDPFNQKDLSLIIKEKLNINDFNYKIIKRSIDARHKDNVFYNYKLIIETNKKLNGKNISLYTEKKYDMKYPIWNKEYRPIIVGFGPAGMFAALYFARCKANPIIIERGSKIEDRKKDLDLFIKNKKLNINSNVQFGEGGAGTFSDGKLTTNLKDDLINFILNEFYIHGAKEDVLYDTRPHVGTNYLEKIVKNIRLEIESLGGVFYFDSLFNDFKELDNHLKINVLDLKNNNNLKFETNHLLLCLGHSAKDTIRMLYNKNIDMEAKAFSMGVRIEHKKELINLSQYGKYSKVLPAAYYNLSCHFERGIYTFCMCPGGYVIPSQSEENTIVTNGMSNNEREGENSNSALLVDVLPTDYYKSSVLDGIDFQEKYEKLAFLQSKDYKAPANLVKEFLNDEIAKEERSVKTSYPHGIKFTNLSECLPDFVIDNLKKGIIEFDKKLKGFNHPDAILIGIESRSSSPVRIKRDEFRMSNQKYIYPVGEGAGYAGGITSAALDGLKTAIKIIEE